MTTAPSLPTDDDVLSWFDSLSNWGRWGTEDSLGSLNHITPEVTAAAVALARTGRTASCAWDILPTTQAGDVFGPPQRFMITTGEALGNPSGRPALPPGVPVGTDRSHGAGEYIGMAFHGPNVTHLDALSHMFWDGRMYNDRPGTDVTSAFGAITHPITALAGGVVTRGVLLDVAAHRGRNLEPGEGATPADLDAAAQAQGVEIQPGDAVLVRTGYGQRKRTDGALPFPGPYPGLHASCLPWLHAHDVALLGSDTGNDVLPSGYKAVNLPVHAVGIVAMGLWLLDNCDLESVAALAADLRRWEFLFTLAPLRLAGGTGSPANPLAIF